MTHSERIAAIVAGAWLAAGAIVTALFAGMRRHREETEQAATWAEFDLDGIRRKRPTKPPWENPDS